MKRTLILAVLLGMTLPVAIAAADEPKKSLNDPSCRPSGPPCVAKWAVPSDWKGFDGYLVGGGTPVCGNYPCQGQGTWGWDYIGIAFERNVKLNWTKKGLYQGGTGAYRTVGKQCGAASTP